MTDFDHEAPAPMHDTEAEWALYNMHLEQLRAIAAAWVPIRCSLEAPDPQNEEVCRLLAALHEAQLIMYHLNARGVGPAVSPQALEALGLPLPAGVLLFPNRAACDNDGGA